MFEDKIIKIMLIKLIKRMWKRKFETIGTPTVILNKQQEQLTKMVIPNRVTDRTPPTNI